MKPSLQGSLVSFLKVLPDPRVQGRCKHRIIDIAVVSVCALLCGAESWTEIEEFGRQRESWFKNYLALENGIPSHDTFARVFHLLEPRAFESLFSDWAQQVALRRQLEISRSDQQRICIDGKSVAGTSIGPMNSGAKNRALHLVNVFSSSSGLVLMQRQSRSSGWSESDAVLECLDELDLRGALISVDAASAVKKVTDKIRDKKGHYLIPLKGHRMRDLELELGNQNQNQNQKRAKTKFKTLSSGIQKEQSHGRQESRACQVYSAEKLSRKLKTQWKDIKSIAILTRTRETVNHQSPAEPRITEEQVYYASSKKLTAMQAIEQTREHWSVENHLHWRLDISFREDDWMIKDKKASRTLALVRKIAFNLIQLSDAPGSMRVKMKRAAWNPNYLEELILKKAGF